MNTILFLLNNIILGASLAMDALSVSVVNGLDDPHIRRKDRLYMTGAFGLFQFLMPLLGWFFVNHTEKAFAWIVPYVPWAGFFILFILGAKMLAEGIKNRRGVKEQEGNDKGFGIRRILLQAVATSIDALSVGFVTASQKAGEALLSSLVIGVTTFFICLAGIHAGKTFGKKLSFWGQILGGIVLIVIAVRLIPLWG